MYSYIAQVINNNWQVLLAWSLLTTGQLELTGGIGNLGSVRQRAQE